MKNIPKILMAYLLICILVFSNFSAIPANAASSKINKTKVTILKGKSYQLKVKGAKNVKWSSNKKKIATVNSKGKVKAKKVGTATITAKTNNKTYKCKVTVAQPVTKVTLNQNSLSLNMGEAYTLKATATPKKAKNKKVKWITSNANVAVIDNKGVVTAVGVGETTITAKAKDGSGKKAVCAVVVKEINTTEHKTEPTTIPQEIPTSTTESKPNVKPTTEQEVTKPTTEDNTTEVSTTEQEVTTSTTESKTTEETTTEQEVTTSTTESKTTEESATEQEVTTSTTEEKTTEKPTTEQEVTKPTTEEKTTEIPTTENNTTETPTPNVAVDSISLNKDSLSIEVGDSKTLRVTVNPSNATDKTAVWTSSDEDIATVKDGVVTALKSGKTTITVLVGGKSASCVVTVEKTDIPAPTIIEVESVTLDKDEIVMDIDEYVSLTADVLPDNANVKALDWTSSNEGVAIVADGRIKAIQTGTATITATSNNGKTASCKVTVTEPVKGEVSISFDVDTISLKAGETQMIHANVSNTKIPVTWTSTLPGVADVDEMGNITAVSAGKTTITAMIDSVFAACVVTVEDETDAPYVGVSSVTVLPFSCQILVGEKKALSVNIEPANATNKTITWDDSLTKSIAAIDENGIVTGLKKGDAFIYATVDGVRQICVVQVVDSAEIPVESITLDKDRFSMEMGETAMLMTTIFPYNADKTVTWKSMNEDIATVDSNGVVTGKNVGNTEILVTTKNGRQARCAVSVTPQYSRISSFSLNKETLTLELWQPQTLKATILPEDLGINVIWESSDRHVCNVYDGVLEARGEGTATITARAGDKTVTCEVEVTMPDLENPNVRYWGEYELDDKKDGVNIHMYGIDDPEFISWGNGDQGTFKFYILDEDEELCNSIEWKIISSGIKNEIGQDSTSTPYIGTKYEMSQFSGWDPNSELSWTLVRIPGLKMRDVIIGAYVDNELFGYLKVHVTKEDRQNCINYMNYENWKADMKEKLWTDNMTEKEKVFMFASYSMGLHYYYEEHDCIMPEGGGRAVWAYYCPGCHHDCMGATSLIRDIARDLGLESTTINYSGEIGAAGGHIMAYVHFSDGWMIVDATPLN